MEQFLYTLAAMAVSGLVAYLISHGYNMRNNQAIVDKQSEHSTLIKEHADKLNKHMDDNDAHWTSRERESLTKQIDRIEDGVQKLLSRSSGDLRP